MIFRLNQKMFSSSLPLGLLFLTMISCGKTIEEVDEDAIGLQYFPITNGKSWTYASDSIVYTFGGAKIDTFRSFINEQIGDTVINSFGIKEYKVFRSLRKRTTDPWTRINTWTVSIENNNAIRNEENLKFVKLVFPIKKGLRWDGNTFIDKNLKIDVGGELIEAYKNWKHTMEEIDIDYPYNNATVQAIKVKLVDETSIIDQRKVTEYYGKDIGLLKKEMTILDLDGNKPSDPIEKKIQKGFKHTLTLIEVK
ncbi:MAG: hypothetical protein WBO36_15950 [Saprospiraceae bacterium]